jgi:hypothetical protein
MLPFASPNPSCPRSWPGTAAVSVSAAERRQNGEIPFFAQDPRDSNRQEISQNTQKSYRAKPSFASVSVLAARQGGTERSLPPRNAVNRSRQQIIKTLRHQLWPGKFPMPGEWQGRGPLFIAPGRRSSLSRKGLEGAAISVPSVDIPGAPQHNPFRTKGLCLDTCSSALSLNAAHRCKSLHDRYTQRQRYRTSCTQGTGDAP